MDTIYKELHSLYVKGTSSEAVALARQTWHATAPLDDLTYLCGAVFIDRGGEIDDSQAIRDGITIFTAFGEKYASARDSYIGARYNLANGYAALAKHCERQDDLDGRLANWHLKRWVMHELILNPGNIPDDIKAKLFVNFGNLLSEFQRKSEALYFYNKALKVEPEHPMALGAAGQVYLKLIGIQPKHNVLILARARELLQAALANPDGLDIMGGHGAAEEFSTSLATVELMIQEHFPKGMTEFEEHISSSKSAHAGWKPEADFQCWIDNDLLLTLNPYPSLCPLTIRDDLFFDGLVTGTTEADLNRFTQLAHTLNQVKEEYATSRSLLSMSQKTADLKSASEVTHYADTLDYSDFGLASGLLKTSMRQSIDILDKLANFLNRYLELGVDDHKVSFVKIWYEKWHHDPLKRVLHPKLLPFLGHASWLKGVKDVADMVDIFPAPAKKIRNQATHDFLLIENAIRPHVIVNGKAMDVDAHELALQLLVMAKGAIINTIAFVQLNEGTQREDKGRGPLLPMEFSYGKGISDFLESDIDLR